MDERAIDRVIEILETDPDFYVPVRKLWLILRQEGLAPTASAQALYTLLAADSRFEFIEVADPIDRGELSEQSVADLEGEMESAGFFSGPRVKLVARPMTAADVFAGLSRSLEQLNEALRGAWQSRPEGDSETEEMLREALSMAQQLQHEVHEITAAQQEESPPPQDPNP